MSRATQDTAQHTRNRGFDATAALLALPVALAAVVSFANVKLPQTSADFNAALSAPVISSAISGRENTQESSRDSVAERLFQSSWGSADPDVHARIAMAFEADSLREAALHSVECRAQLCRVSFDAAPQLPVRKLLPVQLAQVFETIVTVHEGGTNLVYVDVPGRN